MIKDVLVVLLDALEASRENPKVVLDPENQKITVLLTVNPYIVDYTYDGISKAIKELEDLGIIG